MAKNYTDQQRYEFVRKFKISGLSMGEFVEQNNINRRTLSDWISAYNNISGKFINVKTVSENENNIITNKDYVVNILSDTEIKHKSTHFSRFDHSIVVIEYKDIKITTSLEQAERLLDRLYDHI